MSSSEDTWLSTRNKTKVPVKQGPLKRRASLPKSTRPRPPGIYTLTQTSPPPKELFSAKKQSKLSNFFGKKTAVSAVEPEKSGPCDEQKKENLAEGSNKQQCTKTTENPIELGLLDIKEYADERHKLLPLQDTIENNQLTQNNKSVKRLFSDGFEESAIKRFKTELHEVRDDLNKDDVQLIKVVSEKNGLSLHGSAKLTTNNGENRPRNEILKQIDLGSAILENIKTDEMVEKVARIENKRTEKKLVKGINLHRNEYGNRSDEGILWKVHHASERKAIKDMKPGKRNNDHDLLEDREETSNEFIDQLESDCLKYVQLENCGLDANCRNYSRLEDRARIGGIFKENETNCNKMSVTYYTSTQKDVIQDSSITNSENKGDLDISLDLSESSCRSRDENSLHLETQNYSRHMLKDSLCDGSKDDNSLNLDTQTYSGHMTKDSLCDGSKDENSLNLETQTYSGHTFKESLCDSESQLNLSEDSNDSLVFCTQFSLNSS